MLRTIKEKYDATAESYSEIERSVYHLENNLMEARNLIHKIEDCAVVDFACGSGAAIMSLAREFPGTQFTGFDFSRELISIARWHNLQKNVRFYEGDVETFNQNMPFNVLFLVQGLLAYYSPQSKLAKNIQEVWNRQEKGGLIITFHNAHFWGSLFRRREKEYWKVGEAIKTFVSEGDSVKVRYYSFFLVNPFIRKSALLDRFFLWADKVLGEVPGAQYFFNNFELIIMR